MYTADALAIWGIFLAAIVFFFALKVRRRQRPATPLGTLRDVTDSDGSRRLTVRLDSAGALVIEGTDHGAGVDRVLGFREYEWVWTIAATDVPALLQALEATDDVVSAIHRRFSGDAAADLGPFLEAHGIPVERWSRTGD